MLRPPERVGRPIKIDMVESAAPSKKIIGYENDAAFDDVSIYDAADHLWKNTYPEKSKWWLIMRRVVLGYDWLMRFVSIALRVAILGLVIWFVVDWVPFIWDARDLVQEVVLQWLEGFKD